MEQEFKECGVCIKKPGSPTLCESCLHNRKVVQELKDEKFKFEKTLEIIKELLNLQGIY
jgi:hypothetical protein